ncbi:hypothetical protein NDU88_005092 [Pleurodeles waltl]|uniref:Uncharacterized protein n=1 Tax=Pleurodeles waltl TaxID=8319 RepID=A0AAV7WWM3_PLEWA|nr:hypothetical protein NDU88_005092 [Pleurodeles waltl]
MTTGVSPFVLFRRRCPNTILEPGWVNKFLDNAVCVNKDGYVKERELSKVKKSKTRFDCNHAVKVTKVKVGDLVMIKRPGMSIAGCKLSKPLRVVKIFTNAVKTCDHRVWNLNRVVLYKGGVVQEHQDDYENSTKAGDNYRDSEFIGNSTKVGDNSRDSEFCLLTVYLTRFIISFQCCCKGEEVLYSGMNKFWNPGVEVEQRQLQRGTGPVRTDRRVVGPLCAELVEC